jgi:glycosyltransferase involved in cell wall biosynthesis
MISVIIPAYNEESYIGETLESVKNQDHENYEIIVIDNCSTDRTAKISERFTNNVLIMKSNVAKARNIGAMKAKGEILLFLDADTTLERNFLRDVADRFENSDIISLYPYIKTKGRAGDKVAYFLSFQLIWLLSIIGFPLFPTMCVAYRKKEFEVAGGFEEKYITAEDIVLTRRIKEYGKCVVEKDIVVYTSSRRSSKMGALNFMHFHTINFFRFLLGRPSRNYPLIR